MLLVNLAACRLTETEQTCRRAVLRDQVVKHITGAVKGQTESLRIRGQKLGKLLRVDDTMDTCNMTEFAVFDAREKMS